MDATHLHEVKGAEGLTGGLLSGQMYLTAVLIANGQLEKLYRSNKSSPKKKNYNDNVAQDKSVKPSMPLHDTVPLPYHPGCSHHTFTPAAVSESRLAVRTQVTGHQISFNKAPEWVHFADQGKGLQSLS